MSGTFTQAMQGQQAQAGQLQAQQLQMELKQVAQSVEALIQKLRQVPGINPQMFSQGVAEMKQGMQTIVNSMPQRPQR